jgi:hypothetical protein
MDSNTLPIGKVFGQDRRLIVPLFQRPYVWNREDQWEPLWSDILNVATRVMENRQDKPHFLGAIVLDAQRRPLGHLETRLIIDGQQRLTTLQLLFEAFCDICADTNQERYHRALLKLTRNDDPMSDDPDDVFKVWPTTVDQNDFRRVMMAPSRTDVLAEYGKPATAESTGHRIADCYLFFYNEIMEWLKPEEDGFVDRLKVVYDVLRDGLRVVAIDLDELDDPQMIFETLNARGTPLLPADLIKNHLFYKAPPNQMESLYQRFWRPFDENDHYWRHQIGRGHARRARIDLFLQNYLTAKKRDEVATTHLYVSFRDYVSDSSSNGGIADRLADIQKYAGIYQHFDQWSDGTREKLFFQRLADMDIVTAHPFVLELFASANGDDEETQEVLVMLESFLVRRMICGLNTRGYNRLFVDMLGTLAGEGSVVTRVREFLSGSSAASNRWPNDSEFETAWIAKPIYEILVRKRVQMLLSALNLQLHHRMTEDVSYPKLQIEHLLPQSWSENYPLPVEMEEHAAIERRNAVLHTIGNLTLITPPLNNYNSNDPWDVKLQNILTYSALNLNRRLADYLDGNVSSWDETAINKRSVALFDLAKTIWPFPISTGQ